MLSKRTGILATAVLAGLMALPTFAQNAPPGGGGGGGQTNNGGGGGNGRNGRNSDPAQMRQRMMDRIKDQMGMSDDDFKAIEPKLQAVMDLQRDANSARMAQFGRMGGRRNRGGDNNNNGGGGGGGGAAQGGGAQAGGPGGEQQGPVATAAHDLQETLDNKDAKPDDIKAKLAAYRDAKTKNHDALVKAQNDLKDLLTQRQEAVLVMSSILD